MNAQAKKLLASDEWRAKKFNELCGMSFDSLRQLQDDEFEYYELHGHWSSFYGYVLVGIINDVCNSVKYDELKAHYPSILFGRQELPYYLHAEKVDSVADPEPKKADMVTVTEQLTLF